MKGFRNPYKIHQDQLVALTWCLKHKGVAKDMIKYITQFIQVDFSVFNNTDGKISFLKDVYFVPDDGVGFTHWRFDWQIPEYENGKPYCRRTDACKHCLGPIVVGAICMWCTAYPFATTDLTPEEFKKRNILYKSS